MLCSPDSACWLLLLIAALAAATMWRQLQLHTVNKNNPSSLATATMGWQ